jgi:hypothetical protein
LTEGCHTRTIKEGNVSETKSKRKVTFDAKRAGVFEAHGVRTDNIDPRQVAIGFDGVDQDEQSECALCDHWIKFLYVLHLGLTSGKVVTFAPVGSSCIRTWADSLPISEAQAAIVAALKVAEEKAESIKSSFRTFNALAASRNISEGDRDALVRFLGAPPRVRDNPFLADVAGKVEKFRRWASDRQRDTWLAALNRELRSGTGKGLAAVPPSAGGLGEEDRALLARAAVILGTQPPPAGLSEDDRGILADIHAKVTRYQSFRSDKQRGFFASIIKRAEGGSGRKPVQSTLFPEKPATRAEDYDGEVPF